jgi:hypothetical protein
MTKKNAWYAALLALMLLTNLGQVLSFADDFVDDLKGRYGFTNWVGNTETNYSCLVTNWVPTFATFGVTNLISTQEGTWANGSKDSAYFFHPTNKPDATVDLRVQERPGVTDAHNAMMELFGNCSAIQPFPLGTTNTVKVGDRCYLGYPTNAYNRIFFVRNNVFLSVSANQTNCSVQAIAEYLDNQLKAISVGN